MVVILDYDLDYDFFEEKRLLLVLVVIWCFKLFLLFRKFCFLLLGIFKFFCVLDLFSSLMKFVDFFYRMFLNV